MATLDCGLKPCVFGPWSYVQAVVTLRTQYRMAGDIQAVANELVYNGVLRCGCPAVEAATLAVHPGTAQHPAWLQQVLLLHSYVPLLQASTHRSPWHAPCVGQRMLACQNLLPVQEMLWQPLEADVNFWHGHAQQMPCRAS